MLKNMRPLVQQELFVAPIHYFTIVEMVHRQPVSSLYRVNFDVATLPRVIKQLIIFKLTYDEENRALVWRTLPSKNVPGYVMAPPYGRERALAFLRERAIVYRYEHVIIDLQTPVELGMLANTLRRADYNDTFINFID